MEMIQVPGLGYKVVLALSCWLMSFIVTSVGGSLDEFGRYILGKNSRGYSDAGFTALCSGSAGHNCDCFATVRRWVSGMR